LFSRSQKDFWSGLLFAAVGAAFAIGAVIHYAFGESAEPGPGYFPFGLGVVLTILGLTVVARSLTGVDTGRIGRFAWRPLGFVLAAVTLFGFLLPRFGLSIALPVLIVLSAFAGEEFRWKEALVNAVALTALNFAIFVWGLNLSLPR